MSIQLFHVHIEASIADKEALAIDNIDTDNAVFQAAQSSGK